MQGLTITLNYPTIPRQMDRVRNSIRRSLQKIINGSEDQNDMDMILPRFQVLKL